MCLIRIRWSLALLNNLVLFDYPPIYIIHIPRWLWSIWFPSPSVDVLSDNDLLWHLRHLQGVGNSQVHCCKFDILLINQRVIGHCEDGANAPIGLIITKWLVTPRHISSFRTGYLQYLKSVKFTAKWCTTKLVQTLAFIVVPNDCPFCHCKHWSTQIKVRTSDFSATWERFFSKVMAWKPKIC